MDDLGIFREEALRARSERLSTPAGASADFNGWGWLCAVSLLLLTIAGLVVWLPTPSSTRIDVLARTEAGVRQMRLPQGKMASWIPAEVAARRCRAELIDPELGSAVYASYVLVVGPDRTLWRRLTDPRGASEELAEVRRCLEAL